MYLHPESHYTNIPEHWNLHHASRLGHPQFKISLSESFMH